MIEAKDIDWSMIPRPGILDYVNENFTVYPSAYSKGFNDPQNDFLIGQSGGFLMKMDFIFKKMDRFRAASIHYTKHGVYTIHARGTLAFKHFWRTETRRRRFGMTANCKLYRKDIEAYDNATTDEEREALLHPLTITGAHYNYLNYSRIMRTRTEEESKEYHKRGQFKNIPKIKDFPRPWDGDYWKFKVDQFAGFNDYNTVSGKARRKGYSFKEASDSANLVNLNAAISVLHGAHEDKYLTDEGALTYMTKVNLDWYEIQTFWVRNFLSEDLSSLETGYKLSKEGNKSFGFMSKLISAGCARNESALVGKDAYKIKVEEAGKFPNMEEVLGVTLSTTESGATRSGNVSIFGTGGTKGANWEAFEKVFFNPALIDAIPMENIWSINGRSKVCSYFHPQILNYEPHIDEDGNSDLEQAFIVDYVDKVNKQKLLSTEKYIIYIGQRANTPEEAFSQSELSIFTSPELIAHYEYIKRNIDEIMYVDGMFVDDSGIIRFYGEKDLKDINAKFHPFIENYPHRDDQDVHGCVRKLKDPLRIQGEIPKGLYRVTMDTVGIDKDKNGITSKHSLVSISVRAIKNDEYHHSSELMAHYIGRMEERESTDLLALNMCKYYNADMLVETDRGETVANFKKWGESKRLATEPNIVWSTNKYKPSETLGMVIGGATRKLEGYKLVREMLYRIIGTRADGTPLRVFHKYKSVRMLAELLKHNPDGNFDSISDLILQAYDEKRIELVKKYKLEKNKNNANANSGLNYKKMNNPLKRLYYGNW
jgi:hypothetical protein